MALSRLSLLALLLLAFLASPARADVTARYHLGTTIPLVIQANDAGQARINLGSQAAVIVRDGVAYMVMADLQGRYAIRYEDLMSAFDEATRPMVRRDADEALEADFDYEAVELGPAAEGGYQGTAWTIARRGQARRSDPFEIVISTDPRLAPVGRVLTRLSANTDGAFAPVWNSPSFSHGFVAAMTTVFERGTMIRFGRIMRLESASTDPIAPTTFELPGEPLTREQFVERAGLPRIAAAPGAPPASGTPAALPPPRTDGRGGSRARANLASYISDSDYPPEAIIQGEEGIAGFQLEVAPDGTVKSCRITASSGSAALDEATCRIMTERPRFLPARDRRGRPVTDRVSSRIRWVLPIAWPGDPAASDPAADAPGR